MSASTIQSQINSVYSAQQNNQFGSARNALLFKPGTYNVTVPVGFYTQVLGLGQSPDDVSVATVRSDAYLSGNNATCNFWRGVENFATGASRQHHPVGGLAGRPLPPDARQGQPGPAPERRLGERRLDLRLEDRRQRRLRPAAAVDLAQRPVGQLDRLQLEHGVRRRRQCARRRPGRARPTPRSRQTPDRPREAVPLRRRRRSTPSSSRRCARTARASPGAAARRRATSIPIDQFYVARAGTDTAATINAALGQGQAPAAHPRHLQPERHDPRHERQHDRARPRLRHAEADDRARRHERRRRGRCDPRRSAVRRGKPPTPPCCSRSARAEAPRATPRTPPPCTTCSSASAGPRLGKATVSIRINSNDVIGDHFWIWRADHGTGVGWTSNTAANGLVVNGNNVTDLRSVRRALPAVPDDLERQRRPRLLLSVRAALRPAQPEQLDELARA